MIIETKTDEAEYVTKSEFRQGINDINQKLISQQVYMNNEFASHRNTFKAIDARFDAIDRKFDAINRRFEAIDERFKSVDAGFDKIDERFTSLEKLIKDQIGLVINHIDHKTTVIMEHPVFSEYERRVEANLRKKN